MKLYKIIIILLAYLLAGALELYGYYLFREDYFGVLGVSTFIGFAGCAVYFATDSK